MKQAIKKLSHIIPDKIYIRLRFHQRMGKFPNLKNPTTFSEKLHWLKLYGRDPKYSTMVDKYEAKKYIADIIGEEYIIPTLGVWEKFDDIDFDALPDKFVLKCTHDSGGVIICKDKASFDIKKAKEKITKSLKTNYYWQGREWPYKNVKPRIIVEEYIEDNTTGESELLDYKFFAFNGDVKRMFVARKNLDRFYFFDMDYNYIPGKNPAKDESELPEKPHNFEKMIELASILSKGIPQLRVDFYEVNGKLYIGELTFFHNGGLVPFKLPDWDIEWGKFIELPEKTHK